MDRRSELIEKLALIEVEIDSIRKELPDKVESLEKLLNSVDELNLLGKERNLLKAELMATIKVLDSSELLEGELKQLIQESYDAAKSDPIFYVGVSGGSFPPLLIKVLKQLHNVDWKKWLFFFCDERCVPSTSPDSTFGQFRKLLEPIDEKLNLSLNQFITIDSSLKSSKIADDYLSKMRQRFEGASLPKFHILFLGLGPDGHTCSLFPGHRLLKVSRSTRKLIVCSYFGPLIIISLTNNLLILLLTGNFQMGRLHIRFSKTSTRKSDHDISRDKQCKVVRLRSNWRI